jgi:hypothetical protein
VSTETDPPSPANVPGMPVEMTDAVNRLPDEQGRQRALATWSRLPASEQELARNYVEARHSAAWRRRRAEKSAQKLSAGATPPRRVRLPRWLSTIIDIISGAA